MADKPDLSDLKNKLGLGKIIDTIAGVVEGGMNSLSGVDPNDAIGKKIAKIQELVEGMQKDHQERADKLGEVDSLLKGLFVDVNDLRKASKEAEEATAAPEEKPAEKNNKHEPVAAAAPVKEEASAEDDKKDA